MSTLTLHVVGVGIVTKVHETDEFEDWARLAASIGQYTQRHDVDPPLPNGKASANGSAVNGHGTTNGHANGNGVDRLPNFLMQGPAVDEEPPADELFRATVAKKSNGGAKSNGAARPHVKSAVPATPVPFLLTEALPELQTEALPEDLEIPPEPVAPPMSALEPPLRHAASSKAKVRKEVSPAAARPRQTDVPTRGFDNLRTAPVPTKRVGVSAPPPADRPGLSRRRLRHRLKKGATVAAVGVTIGGVAVAILYIVIVATITVF